MIRRSEERSRGREEGRGEEEEEREGEDEEHGESEEVARVSCDHAFRIGEHAGKHVRPWRRRHRPAARR